MIFTFLFSMALAAGLQETHQHHNEPQNHAEEAKLKLNKGKKWNADEPLRTGMAHIRQVVQGPLSPEKSSSAAQTIDDSVQNIFKNCKLSPEADATLHVILMDVIKGSSSLKKSHSEAEVQSGVELIHKALKNYETYFDDKSAGEKN